MEFVHLGTTCHTRVPVTSLAAWYHHLAVQQHGGRSSLQHSLLAVALVAVYTKDSPYLLRNPALPSIFLWVEGL